MKMFEGIDPPRSRNFFVMICPLGLTLGRYPFSSNRFMSGEYSFRTCWLFAFGQGVFDNHQTHSTASFTRILRTFTHSAGDGSLPGLYQKNSWAKWNPTSLQSAISNSK